MCRGPTPHLVIGRWMYTDNASPEQASQQMLRYLRRTAAWQEQRHSALLTGGCNCINQVHKSIGKMLSFADADNVFLPSEGDIEPRKAHFVIETCGVTRASVAEQHSRVRLPPKIDR